MDCTKVAHKLGGCLCNESTFLAKLGGVGDAVITVVGGAKTGEFVGVCHPVKLATVNDCATNGHSVSVNILGCGVGDDVCAPLIGLQFTGVAKVLSMMRGTPWRCATFAKSWMSMTASEGLATVSPNTALVLGRIAASISSSVLSGEMKVKSMPIFFMVTENRLKVPP